MQKGVLRNFPKFTGKHLRQNLFFNKVAGLRCAILLKKRVWHWCFPVNFTEFLRAPFLQNTSDDCFYITIGFITITSLLLCSFFSFYILRS